MDVTDDYERLSRQFREVEFSLESSKPIYQTHCLSDIRQCEQMTMCDAFELGGWNETGDRLMESTSFFIFDWMSGSRCDRVSFYSYMQADIEDPHDFMVTDPRGFAFLIRSLASQYLTANDSRLRFNEVVTVVDYSETNLGRFGKPVVVRTRTNTYLANYVLVTVSNGVILNGDLRFVPQLPDWKLDAIKYMPTSKLDHVLFSTSF